MTIKYSKFTSEMNEFGLIYVDLKSGNTSEMAIEYNKMVHYFQTNSYCLFSSFLRGFCSEMAEYCSGVETMRGFGHEIHGRSVRIELGNIFKLVSWENLPFVKHPSSAIHHRRETISQMTKIVRKVLVRSKPSNTAAWWFHVDFPPYLG